MKRSRGNKSRRGKTNSRFTNPNYNPPSRKEGQANAVEMANAVNRANGKADDEDIRTMAPGQIWLAKPEPTLYVNGEVIAKTQRVWPHLLLVNSCDHKDYIELGGKNYRFVTVFPLIPVQEHTGSDEIVLLSEMLESSLSEEYAVQLWNPIRVLFHNFAKYVTCLHKNSPLALINAGRAEVPTAEQERIFSLRSDAPAAITAIDQRRLVQLRESGYLKMPGLLVEELFTQYIKRHRTLSSKPNRV